jgi:hypothetical protein
MFVDIWKVIEKARKSEEDMDRSIKYTSQNDRLQMILDNLPKLEITMVNEIKAVDSNECDT